MCEWRRRFPGLSRGRNSLYLPLAVVLQLLRARTTFPMKPWESWSIWPFCLGVFPPQSRAETHRFFKGNLTPSVCTGCAPDVLISLYFLSEQCLPLNFIWFNNYLTERAVQHSTKLCTFLEPRINLKTNDGWREKLLFMGRPESCMFCDDENIFLSVDSGLLNLQLKHASDSTFISLIHLNFAHVEWFKSLYSGPLFARTN